MYHSFIPVIIKHVVISKPVTLSVLFSLLLILTPAPGHAFESKLENGSNLSLFGIGIHQEKRNDIYVGALFAPEEISETNQLLDKNISKRMSLKFISKYSNRKMARLWKQRIAMNNPKVSWRPLTKEIVQFAGIFKRAMQAGDEVNIDFIPGIGTSVYLNKTLFLTIHKLEFYELLLNIWIGSIPPTESFKTGISGNNTDYVNEKLIAQYERLQPEVGRFDPDKVSYTQLQTKVANSSKTKSVNSQKTTATKNKATAKKQPVNKNIPSQALSETQQLVNNLKNNLTVPRSKVEIEKPKIEFDKLFTSDFAVTTVKKASNANQTVAAISRNQSTIRKLPPVIKTPTAKVQKQDNLAKPTKAKEKVAKLDLPEKGFFDADLLSGSYTLALINNIRSHQSYPKKALAAGIEGLVTIQIKIDKEGEILSKKIIRRSGSRVLDRAVLRMVRRAVPFPKIPQELDIQEFEFEVPMSFTLAK